MCVQATPVHACQMMEFGLEVPMRKVRQVGDAQLQAAEHQSQSAQKIMTARTHMLSVCKVHTLRQRVSRQWQFGGAIAAACQLLQ